MIAVGDLKTNLMKNIIWTIYSIIKYIIKIW